MNVSTLDDVALTRLFLYLQQDSSCTLQSTSDSLNGTYPDRWIRRYTTIAWPLRSPDLNPVNYCLWGHMKSLEYKEKTNARNALLHRILTAQKM